MTSKFKDTTSIQSITVSPVAEAYDRSEKDAISSVYSALTDNSERSVAATVETNYDYTKYKSDAINNYCNSLSHNDVTFHENHDSSGLSLSNELNIINDSHRALKCSNTIYSNLTDRSDLIKGISKKCNDNEMNSPIVQSHKPLVTIKKKESINAVHNVYHGCPLNMQDEAVDTDEKNLDDALCLKTNLNDASILQNKSRTSRLRRIKMTKKSKTIDTGKINCNDNYGDKSRKKPNSSKDQFAPSIYSVKSLSNMTNLRKVRFFSRLRTGRHGNKLGSKDEIARNVSINSRGHAASSPISVSTKSTVYSYIPSTHTALTTPSPDAVPVSQTTFDFVTTTPPRMPLYNKLSDKSTLAPTVSSSTPNRKDKKHDEDNTSFTDATESSITDNSSKETPASSPSSLSLNKTSSIHCSVPLNTSDMERDKMDSTRTSSIIYDIASSGTTRNNEKLSRIQVFDCNEVYQVEEKGVGTDEKSARKNVIRKRSSNIVDMDEELCVLNVDDQFEAALSKSNDSDNDEKTSEDKNEIEVKNLSGNHGIEPHIIENDADIEVVPHWNSDEEGKMIKRDKCTLDFNPRIKNSRKENGSPELSPNSFSHMIALVNESGSASESSCRSKLCIAEPIPINVSDIMLETPQKISSRLECNRPKLANTTPSSPEAFSETDQLEFTRVEFSNLECSALKPVRIEPNSANAFSFNNHYANESSDEVFNDGIYDGRQSKLKRVFGLSSPKKPKDMIMSLFSHNERDDEKNTTFGFSKGEPKLKPRRRIADASKLIRKTQTTDGMLIIPSVSSEKDPAASSVTLKTIAESTEPFEDSRVFISEEVETAKSILSYNGHSGIEGTHVEENIRNTAFGQKCSLNEDARSTPASNDDTTLNDDKCSNTVSTGTCEGSVHIKSDDRNYSIDDNSFFDIDTDTDFEESTDDDDISADDDDKEKNSESSSTSFVSASTFESSEYGSSCGIKEDFMLDFNNALGDIIGMMNAAAAATAIHTPLRQEKSTMRIKNK